MTSNQGYEEWGSVLGDEVVAAALVGRLVYCCHIVTIRGNTYRMRAHQEVWRSMQAASRAGRPPQRTGT